jgi:hypothetical protein
MEETITILYNGHYGGFGVSDKALELYNLRMKEINSDFTPVKSYDLFFERHDPILVDIYNELGKDFGREYSKIKVENIPKKYEKFYVIEEYDGLENVIIDENKYKLDKIKEILKEENGYKEKIEEIETLLK